MTNPIEKFNTWWKEAKLDSVLEHSNAVCVSTISKDGFPSGRFVDLKSADDKGFAFCTYLDSVKGQEIDNSPKVAMTIWWDHVGYQVRIIGLAEVLPTEAAIRFWKTRTRSAQITTLISNQSNVLKDHMCLEKLVEVAQAKYANREVPMPSTWGGYLVKPTSIEFLGFKVSRLHTRELFVAKNGVWDKCLLQP
jgi:pyridoxamine 5'-phosphate oxidase